MTLRYAALRYATLLLVAGCSSSPAAAARRSRPPRLRPSSSPASCACCLASRCPFTSRRLLRFCVFLLPQPAPPAAAPPAHVPSKLRVVGEGPDVNLNRRGAASSISSSSLSTLLACTCKVVCAALRLRILLTATLSTGCNIFTFLLLPPLRQRRGLLAANALMLFHMRRLNAHGRSSTVRPQRPQPTGAVVSCT